MHRSGRHTHAHTHTHTLIQTHIFLQTETKNIDKAEAETFLGVRKSWESFLVLVSIEGLKRGSDRWNDAFFITLLCISPCQFFGQCYALWTWEMVKPFTLFWWWWTTSLCTENSCVMSSWSSSVLSALARFSDRLLWDVGVIVSENDINLVCGIKDLNLKPQREAQSFKELSLTVTAHELRFILSVTDLMTSPVYILHNHQIIIQKLDSLFIWSWIKKQEAVWSVICKYQMAHGCISAQLQTKLNKKDLKTP